jgi:hypothetical protein
VLGIGISYSSVANDPVWLQGRWVFPSNILTGTFVAAHLVLVFVRSHGNASVFKRTPWRFTLVPALLFVALYSSLWVSIVVTVLAVWWDVYHSGLQTFGLGRIYDMRAGNDPEVGRRLDQLLNHLLYLGPILGGATLANHLKLCDDLELLDKVFFGAIPARVESVHSSFAWGVLGVGSAFLAYYVYRYWQFAKAGYAVSPQKVFLLVSTGVCSIYTWGFNSFGEAFFIMNFFHAWQYFAIVWWSDSKNLTTRLRLEGRRFAKPLLLVLFVGVPLGYGAWVTVIPMDGNDALFCLATVVSIMHFWYDGFIWSVRKKQV